MVDLSRTNQAYNSMSIISGWLESYCHILASQYQIAFDVRIQPGLDGCDCSSQLRGLLEKTLLQAASSALPTSTIEVAGHLTRRGIEIEVVASCADSEDESLRAFSRDRSLIGHGFSLATYRARCPDGSVAWIIVQTTAARLRQIA